MYQMIIISTFFLFKLKLKVYNITCDIAKLLINSLILEM